MKRPAITPAMRLQVLKEHKASVMCSECGRDVLLSEVQIDHHLALINGGTHTVDNLRPLCPDPCHKHKSAREHRGNAKSKRLALAKTIHQQVVAGEIVRPKSRIPSRPFQRRAK